MPAAVLEAQDHRAAGGCLRITANERGDASADKQLFEPLPQGIHTHLSAKSHFGGQRGRGQRAVGPPASDRFLDEARRCLAVL